MTAPTYLVRLASGLVVMHTAEELARFLKGTDALACEKAWAVLEVEERVEEAI